jgi:hypothetical protein
VDVHGSADVLEGQVVLVCVVAAKRDEVTAEAAADSTDHSHGSWLVRTGQRVQREGLRGGEAGIPEIRDCGGGDPAVVNAVSNVEASKTVARESHHAGNVAI